MSDTYLTFMTEVLVPSANKILREKFESYSAGEDIGIETKSDATPASLADRETEAALRFLIKEQYPEHGIWGEEFGAENVDRDYVWVLDPLDGTKEFLAKRSGCFGTLIGLLYKGQALTGSISDPLNGTLYTSNGKQSLTKEILSIKDSIVACTNPVTMFKTVELQRSIQAIEKAALGFKTHLNCFGFSGVVDGEIDVAVENNLGLHDLVALIPILQNSGIRVLDFEGNDYSAMIFDLSNENKFGVIATANAALSNEILSIFKEYK